MRLALVDRASIATVGWVRVRAFRARWVPGALLLALLRPASAQITTENAGVIPPGTPILRESLSYFDSEDLDEVRWSNQVVFAFDPTREIKLDVPVLTLHTTRDPMAPIFHEALLSQKAADAGRLDNLVRREVDVFGHCALTAGEIMTAFTDLATWVNSGVKPAP